MTRKAVAEVGGVYATSRRDGGLTLRLASAGRALRLRPVEAEMLLDALAHHLQRPLEGAAVAELDAPTLALSACCRQGPAMRAAAGGRPGAWRRWRMLSAMATDGGGLELCLFSARRRLRLTVAEVEAAAVLLRLRHRRAKALDACLFSGARQA
jgi:hypothetical protein